MILQLTNNGCSAAIDSFGAQLISWKDQNQRELIWQRDPAFWPRCSPLLFPVVGACKDGSILIDGKTYPMQKHGFCKEHDFTVNRLSESKAVFSLQEDEQTRESYPFSFRLSLTYELKANGSLSFLYEVQNPGGVPLFYCIGTHPGFCCPLFPQTNWADYLLQFEKKEDTVSLPYDTEQNCFDPSQPGVCLHNTDTLPLTRDLFAKDALCFLNIKSRAVSLVEKNSGHGIRVSFPDFSSIAFWSTYPKEAPFVCIEAWNGSGYVKGEDNVLAHKNHVQKLLPGEHKQYCMTLSLL